jgi:acylphosphatase
MQLAHIRVTGHVQGVVYRASAKREADRLGITGFARNEPDGSVRIDAEGSQTALHEFIDWCHIGPPMAEVDKVDVTTNSLVGYKGFNTL